MTVLASLGLAALLALPLACPDLDDEPVLEPVVETGPRVVRTFQGEISAYCHTGLMASGRQTQAGAAAAGPQFPFGTVLSIDGIGTVIVLDRGGAISGSRIDVWMSSCSRAVQWGRQYRRVEVLE